MCDSKEEALDFRISPDVKFRDVKQWVQTLILLKTEEWAVVIIQLSPPYIIQLLLNCLHLKLLLLLQPILIFTKLLIDSLDSIMTTLCYFRKDSSVTLSWFVNTNEDVADFRVELASVKTGQRPKTLLVKDISYNTRYDVIDHVPGEGELRMCLITKNSLGNIRRWRQDQCTVINEAVTGASLSASLIVVTILSCCYLL